MDFFSEQKNVENFQIFVFNKIQYLPLTCDDYKWWNLSSNSIIIILIDHPCCCRCCCCWCRIIEFSQFWIKFFYSVFLFVSFFFFVSPSSLLLLSFSHDHHQYCAFSFFSFHLKWANGKKERNLKISFFFFFFFFFWRTNSDFCIQQSNQIRINVMCLEIVPDVGWFNNLTMEK